MKRLILALIKSLNRYPFHIINILSNINFSLIDDINHLIIRDRHIGHHVTQSIHKMIGAGNDEAIAIINDCPDALLLDNGLLSSPYEQVRSKWTYTLGLSWFTDVLYKGIASFYRLDAL